MNRILAALTLIFLALPLQAQPAPVAPVPLPGSPSSKDPDANKNIVTSAIESVFNQQKFETVGDYYSPAYLDHSQPLGSAPGFEAIKKAVTDYRMGFPDAAYKIDEVIVAGDNVIVRGVISGQNQGIYNGMPFSGAAGSKEIIEIYRLSGGKIVEHWAQSDELGLLKQITPPGLNPLMFMGQSGPTPVVPPAQSGTATGVKPSGSALQASPTMPDSAGKVIKRPTKPHKPTPPGSKSEKEGTKSGGSTEKKDTKGAN